MRLPVHYMLNYKGYTIYCANSLYYLQGFPVNKYFTLSEVKAEVDRMEATLNENIVNLRGIINQKTNHDQI